MNIIEILDRPIAFQRSFVYLTGSINAALFLSQAIYWNNRTTDPSGWFYKTQADWQDETGLTRREQETARKNLREMGILIEELRGVPAQLFFKIDPKSLQSRLAESALPRKSESSTQVSTKPTIQIGGKRHTIDTETTSEITTETTRKELPKGNSAARGFDEPPSGGFPEEKAEAKRGRIPATDSQAIEAFMRSSYPDFRGSVDAGFKKGVLACWKKGGVDLVRDVIRKALASDFLMARNGHSSTWRNGSPKKIGPIWIFKENYQTKESQWIKILDGVYSNENQLSALAPPVERYRAEDMIEVWLAADNRSVRVLRSLVAEAGQVNRYELLGDIHAGLPRVIDNGQNWREEHEQNRRRYLEEHPEEAEAA